MFPPFVRHLHGRQGGQVQRRRSCNDLPFAIDQFFEILDPAGRVCDDEAIVQPFSAAVPMLKFSLSRMNSVICMEELAVTTI